MQDWLRMIIFRNTDYSIIELRRIYYCKYAYGYYRVRRVLRDITARWRAGERADDDARAKKAFRLRAK